MAPIERLKKVSWALDHRLCQELLFLSEDAPALSRLDIQEKIQAKGSWLWYSTKSPSADNITPGCGGPRSILNKKKETAKIPVIKWCCPDRFVLDPKWLVVSGEESEEVKAQSQLQFRSLEAIYPRTSSIPPNPCVSFDVQNTYYDDAKTPLIPNIADEEQPDSDSFFPIPVDFSESEPVDAWKILSENGHLLFPSKPKSIFENIPGLESDIVTAFISALKSSDKGSFIDHELLIKILSDPSMVEKLFLQAGAPEPAPEPSQVVTLTPNPSFEIEIGHVSEDPLSHIATETPTIPCVPNTTREPKEYYKCLIQRHSNLDSSDHKNHILKNDGNSYSHPKRGSVECHAVDPLWKQQSSRQKSFHSKPCAFFNSPRGCRNGSKCTFMHDIPSSQIQLKNDTDNRKRMKMDI